MINYTDFVPELIEPHTWRTPPVFESMKEVKARVQAWQAVTPCKIINVETVIRPIMYEDQKNHVDLDNAAIVPTMPHHANVWAWLQIIRVWYDDGL